MADVTNPVPGSDEWFQEIANLLLSGGGAPVTDAAVAALISGLQTLSHAAVQAIADAATAGILDQANQAATLADSALRDALTTAFTNADESVLAAANAYTDTHSGTGGVTVEYVDNGDAESVIMANAYTDDQTNAATTAANGYTDTAVGTATTGLHTYADNGDSGTLTTANAYTDTSISDLANNLAALIDSKIEDSSASDLQAAKDYTDSKIGGSGATVSYVDSQDAATLSAAKTYSDIKDVSNLTTAENFATAADLTNLAAAKTYADGKVSDTGWIALTIKTGYTGTLNPAYRVINGVCYLRGQVAINTGNIAADTGVVTIPNTNGRPPQLNGSLVFGATISMFKILVNTNGSIDISNVNSTSTSTYIRLEGCTPFPVN